MVGRLQWGAVEPDIPTALFDATRFARGAVVDIAQDESCDSRDRVDVV